MKLLMIVTITILIALFLILGCQTSRSVYMNSRDCSLSDDGTYYTCYYVKDGKVSSYKKYVTPKEN
jgi:hypothetical protein